MASAVRLQGSATVLAAGVAALYIGACTALWGIDELRYDGTSEPVSSSSSSTSSGGGGATSSTASTTSSSGGATSSTSTSGGAGGAVVCGADCEGCVAPVCLLDVCVAETNACLADGDCSIMVSCMHACTAEDVVCQTECIAASPLTAPLYYALLDCAGCERQECLQFCLDRCEVGCSTGAASCTDCINSACARAVCDVSYAACTESASCLAVSTCIQNCAADDPCKEACASDNPDGAALYRAWARCSICTRPACWDICADDGASCRIWGDP